MSIKKIIVFLLAAYISPTFSVDPIVGINNKGQTCFMNAALQCLYYTEGLTKFLDGIRRDHSNYYKSNSVASEYLEFIKMYQDALGANQKSIDPVSWCQKIWSLEESDKTRFPTGRQGDSYEFLQITLGHLGFDSDKSDINSSQITKRLPYPLQELPENGLTESLGSIVKGFNNSGMLRSIKNESSIALTIVERYTESGDPVFYQDMESAIKDHYAGHKIFKLPQYLPIAIKRFTEDRKKIHQHIAFPLKLNMAEYRDNNGPSHQNAALYELYGIVMHHGVSLGSGHYTAYIKTNDKWYDCSDSTCHETQLNEIETLCKSTKPNEDTKEPSPYILFYKQQSPQPIVYKRIDRSEAENNIKNALAALPLAAEGSIASLKRVIESNAKQLLTNPKQLKIYPNPDKSYKATNRYEYYQEQNKAYTLAVPKIEQILKDSNFDAYFNNYLAQQKISKEDIKRSMEIQLIDAGYLTSQVALFIEESAKDQARKELYEPKKPQSSLIIESINSLQELANSLNSFGYRSEMLRR